MSYSDPKIFDDAMRKPVQPPTGVHYVARSRLKRLLDVVLSSFLIAMVLPLFALISIILWSVQDGRVFRLRPVIGRNGAEFSIFLFRAEGASAGKRFLRSSGLTSLPQLLNVLLGQMSLVGPKPLRIADFDLFKNSVSLYLTAKPGLTGLWFVSDEPGPRKIARSRSDLTYIKTGSFLMDLAILVRTLFVFLRPA